MRVAAFATCVVMVRCDGVALWCQDICIRLVVLVSR